MVSEQVLSKIRWRLAEEEEEEIEDSEEEESEDDGEEKVVMHFFSWKCMFMGMICCLSI